MNLIFTMTITNRLDATESNYLGCLLEVETVETICVAYLKYFLVYVNSAYDLFDPLCFECCSCGCCGINVCVCHGKDVKLPSCVDFNRRS